MIIALEGIDGAGKTTLANKLEAALTPKSRRVTRLARGAPRGPVLAEYEDDIATHVPGSSTHIICDRWHLGELVYGPVLRGESRLDEAKTRHVEMVMRGRGAVVVYLDIDPDVAASRITARGDDLITPDMLPGLKKMYDELFNEPRGVQTLHITGDFDNATKAIINFARGAEGLVRFASPRVIGNTGLPRALYVIEGGYGLPAVPEPGSAAESFLLGLTRRELEQVAVTNMSGEDLQVAWHALNYPRVFALDEDTKNNVERHNVPCRSLA